MARATSGPTTVTRTPFCHQRKKHLGSTAYPITLTGECHWCRDTCAVGEYCHDKECPMIDRPGSPAAMTGEPPLDPERVRKAAQRVIDADPERVREAAQRMIQASELASVIIRQSAAYRQGIATCEEQLNKLANEATALEEAQKHEQDKLNALLDLAQAVLTEVEYTRLVKDLNHPRSQP